MEHLAIAKACTSLEELIAKAKKGGINLSKEKAEVFLTLKDKIQ